MTKDILIVSLEQYQKGKTYTEGVLKDIEAYLIHNMPWVSTEERLPSSDPEDPWKQEVGISKEVLCFSKSHGVRFGAYHWRSNKWVLEGIFSQKGPHVEYWMEVIPPRF